MQHCKTCGLIGRLHFCHYNVEFARADFCRTNAALISSDCGVSNPLMIENDCPSSGWQAIGTYLSLTNNLAPLEFQLEYEVTPSPASIQVTGTSSLRQIRINNESPDYGPGYDPVTAVATTQQAAVADALTTTGILWEVALLNVSTKGHGSVLDQLDAVHSITTGYQQPYTLASCEHDTIFGHEDLNPVAFPPPPGSAPQMLNVGDFNDSILFNPDDDSGSPSHAFIFAGITRPQILDTPGFLGDYRLKWVELPANPFNGTAIGAVVLLPRGAENTTQEVLMCNLGAGWGTSKMNTSTFSGESQTVLSEVSLDPFVSSASRYGHRGLGPVFESVPLGFKYYRLPQSYDFAASQAEHRNQCEDHIGWFVGKWTCQNRIYKSIARHSENHRTGRIWGFGW